MSDEITDHFQRQKIEETASPHRQTANVPSENEPHVHNFSWDFFPDLNNLTLIPFFAEIHCQGEKNIVKFPINMDKLGPNRNADLARLDAILAARDLGERRSLLPSLAWMITISLGQTSPELTLHERRLQAHRLLFLPEPEKSTILGVSPLMICVRQRARDRLWKRHHIDIGELERESTDLYLGLEQFDKIPPAPDSQLRAAAYDQNLIAHHQRVKQAGELLGGSVGDALVTWAESLITRLKK